ncbi:MAG: metallophosphoesterase [Rikenellaceae bacterium]|nr:metallophosphoesterase [Rikenellaceae bacterium]
MKINKILFWMLGVAMFAVGCSEGEPTHDQNGEEQPPVETVEEYVRLNLFSGCGYNAATDDVEATRTAVWDDVQGSGPFTLKWESVDINSDQTDKLSLIISDGENPILGQTESQLGTSFKEGTCSGLSVTPHQGDAHHADFQTVLYYDTEELECAEYCYAVAGDAQIFEDTENGQHLCTLDMPSAFTQTTSQDPRFLRDYLYMYATAAYTEGRTILDFNYIPATFRFVITNTTSHAIAIYGASVSLAEQDGEESSVASKTANVAFDWATGKAELSFEEDGYNKVSVAAGTGASLATGDSYVAYAMALPLASNDALKGKTLNFSVKSDTLEQVAFQLKDTELAALNGSDTYNWVSGKSYTIRIYIKEDGKATGEILEGNRIEVTPDKKGRYTLMYESADAQPLADYAPIGTLPITQIGYYEDFINVNIAPREAKAIGIYNSAGERQGTIQLADFRPDFSENPLYCFGLLSDVHIGRPEINPEADFERALEFFNAKDVTMTCICGDITQNGTEAELKSYQEVTVTAEAPVYTTTGNHDCTYSGINVARWTKYTGQPLVFEQTVEKGGKVDHFLFLGMSVWNFNAAYLESSLVWLQDKLEEYKDERCFIITHLFFPDRAGNLNDIYPSGNWLTGVQLKRLKNMCDRYVNTIWFSGHSHWEWQLQKYQDRANIYRGYEDAKPTSGWCVHVPSCGVPITSNGSSRVDNTSGSEGAVVQVYENHIDIVGIDLKTGKYLPIATYRLDTTPQEIADKEEETPPTPTQTHYITAADFEHNPEKVTGATVSDVEGMPNYVEVTFTKKGQGFWVTNDTFTSSSTYVNIVVEDVKATSNGVEVEVPAHCGFYGGSDYYMTSTESAKVYSGSGVQFQTSNSKYGDGPLPLTLRMKVQMVFE